MLTKKVTLSDGTEETWAATQVKGTDALKDGKTPDDLGAYVGAGINYIATFVKKSSTAAAHFKVTDAEYWANGAEFHFVGKKSASFEVENLFVKAIGERLYPMSNVIVNIDCINEGQDSELNFTPAIELSRAAGLDNFWTATNSAFKPYAGTAYLGREFTLTGPNGNVVKIAGVEEKPAEYNVQDSEGNWYKLDNNGDYQEYTRQTWTRGQFTDDDPKVTTIRLRSEGENIRIDNGHQWHRHHDAPRYTKWEGSSNNPIIKTATTKTGGAWVFGESLVDASVVAYDTNAGSAQSIDLVKAYGLNFALKNNYTGDSNVIRVKLTFKAGSLVYVTTGTTIDQDVDVEFDINMK